MTRKSNDGHVGNSSTRATGCILCVEKTGSEFVLPISSPGLPKNGGWSDRWRAWHLFEVAEPIDSNRWTVFVRLSIGHRLADTNRYQSTNFIDWHWLIDWISDHWFPSIGYPGNLYRTLLTRVGLLQFPLDLTKKFQSWLEESPLIMNYCLQGERLFCYVQASFVIQLWDQIWVWQTGIYNKLTYMYCGVFI